MATHINRTSIRALAGLQRAKQALESFPDKEIGCKHEAQFYNVWIRLAELLDDCLDTNAKIYKVKK